MPYDSSCRRPGGSRQAGFPSERAERDSPALTPVRQRFRGRPCARALRRRSLSPRRRFLQTAHKGPNRVCGLDLWKARGSTAADPYSPGVSNNRIATGANTGKSTVAEECEGTGWVTEVANASCGPVPIRRKPTSAGRSHHRGAAWACPVPLRGSLTAPSAAADLW